MEETTFTLQDEEAVYDTMQTWANKLDNETSAFKKDLLLRKMLQDVWQMGYDKGYHRSSGNKILSSVNNEPE